MPIEMAHRCYGKVAVALIATSGSACYVLPPNVTSLLECLRRAWPRSKYKLGKMQYTHEALAHLYEYLTDEEVKIDGTASTDCFALTSRISTQCTRCDEKRYNDQRMHSMLVHPDPLKSCTLTDLLSKYTGVQTTKGKDYNCDQCQKKVRIRVQYKLEQVHGSSVIVYIERRLASGVGKNIATIQHDLQQDFETSQGIYNGFLVAVEVHYGETWDTGHFVVYKRQVRTT